MLANRLPSFWCCCAAQASACMGSKDLYHTLGNEQAACCCESEPSHHHGRIHGVLGRFATANNIALSENAN